jgi:hypothetical protein
VAVKWISFFSFRIFPTQPHILLTFTEYCSLSERTFYFLCVRQTVTQQDTQLYLCNTSLPSRDQPGGCIQRKVSLHSLRQSLRESGKPFSYGQPNCPVRQRQKLQGGAWGRLCNCSSRILTMSLLLWAMSAATDYIRSVAIYTSDPTGYSLPESHRYFLTWIWFISRS